MPIRLHFKVEGIGQLIQALQGLPDRVRNEELRREIKKLAWKIREDARAMTPIRTGMLGDSLVAKVKIYPRSKKVVGIIGARRGFVMVLGVSTRGKRKGQPRYVDPTRYVHLVELGTYRTRDHHMLRRALQQNRLGFRRAIAEGFRKGIKGARLFRPGGG